MHDAVHRKPPSCGLFPLGLRDCMGLQIASGMMFRAGNGGMSSALLPLSMFAPLMAGLVGGPPLILLAAGICIKRHRQTQARSGAVEKP